MQGRAILVSDYRALEQENYELKQEVNSLKVKIEEQRSDFLTQIASLEKQIVSLEAEIRLHKGELYGKRTEKTIPKSPGKKSSTKSILGNAVRREVTRVTAVKYQRIYQLLRRS